MKIKVTRKHIYEAMKARAFNKPLCGSCPIALALLEQTTCTVNVQLHNVYLNGDVYELPIEAKYFITRFDTHEPVKPFEFELPL